MLQAKTLLAAYSLWLAPFGRSMAYSSEELCEGHKPCAIERTQ
jgi:hypothetical protein